MLQGVRKFVCPEVVVGPGARRLVGRYALNFGARHVLLVSDAGVRAAGWTDEVAAGLAAVGVGHTLFEALSPNPRDHEVMAGVAAYRAHGCDVIVVVGGGSPIDCAKAIGICHTNDRPVGDFEGVDQVAVPGPPLICLPTTSGTAADVSQFSIIGSPERRVKMAIVSKALVPDVALVDPELTATMGPYLTACTGLDALTHAVEAYVSTARSPLTDLHAVEAVRLTFLHLERAVAAPDDAAARDGMTRASLHAGLAFSNAGLGAVHAMAHALGGFLDLPHGACNGILLDAVVATTAVAAARYRDLHAAARATSDLPGATFAAQVEALKAAVGVGRPLRDLGVSRSDLPFLTSNALRDACMATHPCTLSRAEVEAIYVRAH